MPLMVPAPIPQEVEDVGHRVIVELKVAWRLKDIHKRQVVSYLRATNLRLGFVINFNVDILKDGGIKRVAL
jgi:GxxExxY protein